ncbi:TPA: ead/Ea22-like family protein [Enterobacter hormaechei subsp. hoffmannii]|nr:ead/Ea22-like family protein [Enterobacter hormaechei subsp. hoffmannii]
MSNIDKRVLRKAAEKTLNARARLALMQSVFDDDGDDVKPEAQEDISICVSFNDLTNPATVLALLDELEAAEKRIAELERKEQHSERQSVIDALAGSGEEWSDIEEYMQKWDAARAAAAGKGE